MADRSPAEPTTPDEPPLSAAEQVAPETETPAVAESAGAEPVAVEPAVAEQPVPVQPAPAEPAVVEPATPAPPSVVFVEAPQPPKRRGNRVPGVLLALLGTVLFAILLAVGAAIVLGVSVTGTAFAVSYPSLLQSAFYWVPILFFLVGVVLLVLVVNRAGWWAHVLGSLVLAVFVYFGTIFVLLLVNGSFLHGAEALGADFRTLVANPVVITAAVVAREASVWIGLPIAASGRRVKTRNAERLAAFQADLEAKRAEHAGAAG